MQSLDAELVRLVFARLRVQDRGQLAQVCPAWNAIADEPSTWAGEEARLRLTEGTPAELLACVRRRAIRKVKVIAMARPVVDLPRLLKALPETASLDLAFCCNLGDDAIIMALAASQWPLLTSLNLSRCNLITDVSVHFVTRHTPNLEELYLNRCTSITDGSAGHIAANLSKLRNLGMDKTQLTDAGIMVLAGLNEHGLPSGGAAAGCLECLSIRSHAMIASKVGDQGLYYVSLALTNLVDLDVSLCANITDTGIEHISNIPALRKLVCFGCLMLTPQSLRTLATRPFPMYYLDVSNCDFIASDSFKSLAAGPSLRGLSTLRLISLSVTDQRLSMLARTLTDLTYLDISQCRKIRKHGIGALATHLTALRVLVMRFATGLKDGTWRHIARMPRLETVNLKGCRKITSRGPRFIARGDFQPNFFELDVSYTGIGDAGVRYITEALPGLRYLSLSGCVISDKAVSLVARRMRHLHTLHLMGCTAVSNRALHVIATHQKDLRVIDVKGNPRVSEAAKKKLAAALPHLEFL